MRRMAQLLFACLACAQIATAQPQPEESDKPKAPTVLAAPAISRVVAGAVAPIAEHAAGAVVVGAPLASDTPAPRGAALVSKLVGLVAGAIGPTARAVKTPMPLDSARAEAASSPFLVFIQPEIAQGQLRLSVDAYPILRNVWDRARAGAHGPVAHGFADARIDAEVRTFLAPVSLVAANPIKVPLPSPEAVALACEDVDADGSLEIVLVTRRILAMGRLRNGTFTPFRQVSWSNLAPIAAVPWRQPLATLAIAPGQLDVGLTDRDRSLRLDGELREVAAYDGMPVPTPQGVACASRRVGSLTAELGSCVKGDPSPASHAAFPFDAVAAASVVDTGGRVRRVWVVRSPTDGTIALRDDRGGQHGLPHVGAQIALADVDLDGDPDLVASKDVLNPNNDALVIRSWRENGTMDKRVELPVPAGIAALAVCPPDGPGPRTIALATSKELWVLR